MSLALITACFLTAGLAAQDPPPEHHHPPAAAESTAAEGWTLATDWNAFVGYNYQQRLFADFWAWESQNWAMASAARPLGKGRLAVQGMFSLEPWTVGTRVYAKLDGPFGGQPVDAADRRRSTRPARAIRGRRSSTASTRTIW